MTDITLTNNYFRFYIQSWISNEKGKVCDITNKKQNLTVHHMNVSFNELLREAFALSNIEYTFKINGLSADQISAIKENLVLLHQQKAKVVTVSYHLHQLYHKLNYRNISEEQYEVFKRYIKKQRQKSRKIFK